MCQDSCHLCLTCSEVKHAWQIEPPPCHNGEKSYTQGLGKVEDGVKILLAIESLIGVSEEICRTAIAAENNVA